ncbi:gephyrin-like molybdotransferase Glp [Uliginosibacterium gangwonense]|uniref:molybdopterin molybdotransferase MoeA n=1 Tax=Uliginosibacterium gangwonense TaxID=392736 RepID=UPI0003741214
MLSYDEALSTLLAAAKPVERSEMVPVHQALGRVLAQAVVSPINVPPADNSAMDGYAVRVSDFNASDVCLPVGQRIPAGSVPVPLAAGSVARIFTGAPIPTGADAVVMQEKVRVQAEGICLDTLPTLGENVRRAGEDIAQGAEVLPQGTRLGAAHMGLIASVGIAKVKVYARLRVAVFFTGDELLMPGEALLPGTIYNSNRYVLHGLLGALGCEITDLGIVPDNLEATRAALRQAAANHDLVITCGGVSAGEEDHIKAALQAEGALETWKIAIKPGKPFAFGRVAQTPFIGLPGNPVSSYATFLMLARPYLKKCQGDQDCVPRAICMRADFNWPRAAIVREFLRVRRNENGGLDLFPKQGSGVLSSCAWADGLVDNPPEKPICAGDLVRYIPLEA